MSQISRRRRSRRGSIIVLFALFLVVIIGFLAFSIDWGYLVVAESDLQNAADAAALSGARSLTSGREQARAAAKEWAAKNLAAGEAVQLNLAEDVELGLWSDETATFRALADDAPETPNAVRVTCRRLASRGQPVKLFFAAALGVTQAELTASATAAISRNQCGVIVGLEQVDVQNGQIDSFDSATGPYSKASAGAQGHVCSDGPIELKNAGKINGNAFPGQGYFVNLPSRVTGSTTPRTESIPWEPIDLAGADKTNLNHLIPAKLQDKGRLVLGGNTTLKLDPGTYYFPQGIEITGTAQLEITGETRLVIGGSSLFRGRGAANTSNLAKNLRIDILDGEIEFSGSSELYADVYGPTAEVEINGSADFFGAVFARKLSLSGKASQLHADQSLLREFSPATSTVKLKE